MTDQSGRVSAPRYAMRLDFTAADDAQAERLAAAWADTCAAEYATTYHSLIRVSDGAVLAPPPVPDVVGTIVRDRPVGAGTGVDCLARIGLGQRSRRGQ